jgi:hypothetical protein
MNWILNRFKHWDKVREEELHRNREQDNTENFS